MAGFEVLRECKASNARSAEEAFQRLVHEVLDPQRYTREGVPVEIWQKLQR
jgi:hypothetical protein